MRKISLVHISFYLFFTLLLAGCKLALVVVDGGSISSKSGRHDCQSGSNCVIEITAADFNETFVAQPASGFEFSHWLSGDNMLCGGSTNPECVADNTALAGNAGAAAVIATDEIYYILPVFVATEVVDPTPPLSSQLRAKYDGSCAQCHAGGAFGAPVIHNQGAWAPRLAKGMPALLDSVKSGLGSMPPGGNCGNCSDADYEALIVYMSGPAS